MFGAGALVNAGVEALDIAIEGKWDDPKKNTRIGFSFLFGGVGAGLGNVFGQAGGELFKAGAIGFGSSFFEGIAQGGRDEFYKGQTAERIVNTMQEHGGIITTLHFGHCDLDIHIQPVAPTPRHFRSAQPESLHGIRHTITNGAT